MCIGQYRPQPCSTTAVNVFYGTGITLFQLPTKINPGESRRVVSSQEQENGHDPANSRYASAACSVPGWNMDH